MFILAVFGSITPLHPKRDIIKINKRNNEINIISGFFIF